MVEEEELIDGITRLSEVQNLMDLNDFMNDPDFEKALELVLRCIAQPVLKHATARKALLLMQSYAFKFRMEGQVYMTLKKGRAGTDENHKKNIYFSVSEQCHEMAQTLKYLLKEQY